MNIPNLIGYFRYPTLAYYRTRSYFAAFPALLPISAILEYSGTNPFVSATAMFDGQSMPVIVTHGRLEVRVAAKLQDIGRQIDLQWTLIFAQNPTIINYTHRIIVTGTDNINPIPALSSGNPCNIPCESQTIEASGFPNPLYFVITSTNTQYEGFGFNSPLLNGNIISNWCNLDAAGFIDVPNYTIPPYVDTPTWEERNRFCLQPPPRTTSEALVVEIDTNINSPSFGQIRTRTEVDSFLCPVGSTAPDWQDISLPECQPEPRNDCRKQVQQRDENPLSPTFGQTQIVILPPNPNDCVDCPPTSLLPDWQETGEWRCKFPALGRESSEAERKEIDRNPFSPTFNQERWVSIGSRPDLCPLDPNPCNRELWIDVQNPDCSLVTRCKFDAPRYESTRQKQQIQANPRLPNVGETRWVDLPPSPEDELLCPIESCPIYIAVCPEQIRCKFEEPRISSVVEQLQVDINPHSPTFGQQFWVEIGENPDLCPITPNASQTSISSASPYAFAVPQDSNPAGCRQAWFFARTNNFGWFDFSAGINDPRTIKWRWDINRSTYNDIRIHNPPNTLPYWIQMGLQSNDYTKVFDCWTRIDDVENWAKAYHDFPAILINSTSTGQVLTGAWLSSLFNPSDLTAKLTLYSETGNVLAMFTDPYTELIPDAPYNIYYVSQFVDPHCQVGWGYPHRNNQVDPPQPIPDGYRLRFEYFSPFFIKVGVFRYEHELFINGQLYASQSGWIRNLP